MRNSSARTVTVIADNGGGITLQIVDKLARRWQHHYYGQRIPHLAADLRAALRIPADCGHPSILSNAIIREYAGHPMVRTGAYGDDNYILALRECVRPKLNLAAWEGDETSDGWWEPTHEEQRNGGCRVYDAADVLAMRDPDEAWGRAMGVLVTALVSPPSHVGA